MRARGRSADGARPRRRAPPASGLRVVLSTAPPAAASRLARLLVEERLAACVNLVPGVRSVYRWKGRVEAAAETLLVVKTSAARVRACLARLAQAHPYEVAEGIVLPASGGLPPYVRWALESTQPA